MRLHYFPGVIILIFCFLFSFGQHRKPCEGPLPSVKFKQKFDLITSSQNETQKLRKAKELSIDFCLSTEQVKAIAELFVNDYNRLDFVEVAYPNTTDKENFYDVYDSFAYFSNVFRLHDFINGLHAAPVPVPPVELPNVPPPHSPPPTTTPCQVTDIDFVQVKDAISKQSFNSTKVTVAKQVIAAKQCFSADQVREIVKLFSFEDSRLEIAKYAYDYCIEKRNYFKVNDAFSFSSSTEELAKYINSKH